jgi:hypothetical protein
LSASVDNKTKIVHAIIHGCTKRDVTTFSEWMNILMPDIFHPLLLPVLVVTLIRKKHSAMVEEYSENLVLLSGATRQYDNLPRMRLDHVDNYNVKTREVLQLHQDTGDLAVASAQTRTHIRKLMGKVKDKELISTSKEELAESLRLRQHLEETLEEYDHIQRLCEQVKEDCNMLMGTVSPKSYF